MSQVKTFTPTASAAPGGHGLRLLDRGLGRVQRAAYAELFGSHRPARAVVPVGPLHYGFAVEVEAVAFVGA